MGSPLDWQSDAVGVRAMAMVVVFGIEVDRSGDSDERGVRRRALRNLGRLSCKTALFYLIDRYARSGDCDEREVRKMAFEMLEEIDGLR